MVKLSDEKKEWKIYEDILSHASKRDRSQIYRLMSTHPEEMKKYRELACRNWEEVENARKKRFQERDRELGIRRERKPAPKISDKDPAQELYELEKYWEINGGSTGPSPAYYYKRRSVLLRRIRGQDARYLAVGVKAGKLTKEEEEKVQMQQAIIDIKNFLDPGRLADGTGKSHPY
jgi:hypothetical protein